MTLTSAIAEIHAACEQLIKAHDYDPESDGCAQCDLAYPCHVRTTAEDVVTGLTDLVRLDSPSRSTSGPLQHLEESHGNRERRLA
jgi:hypothetical protein